MYKVSTIGTYTVCFICELYPSLLKFFVAMHRGLISVGTLPPWKRAKFWRENATCGCSMPLCMCRKTANAAARCYDANVSSGYGATHSWSTMNDGEAVLAMGATLDAKIDGDGQESDEDNEIDAVDNVDGVQITARSHDLEIDADLGSQPRMITARRHKHEIENSARPRPQPNAPPTFKDYQRQGVEHLYNTFYGKKRNTIPPTSKAKAMGAMLIVQKTNHD